MAVDYIEEYRMKNGMDILMVHLTPQKHFPINNFFFADAEDIDLVTSCSWSKCSTDSYIKGRYRGEGNKVPLHREVMSDYLGDITDLVDHKNMIRFDNCSINLDVVTKGENLQNKFNVGYFYVKRDKSFDVQMTYQLKTTSSQYVKNEYEACTLRHEKEMLEHANYYKLEVNRTDSLDILVEERKGIISEEEAIKKHLEKYKDNAWYYYRFGLDEWHKLFNWDVPKFALDDIGYMRHPITNEKLSPYTHSSHVGVV